jgi:hypothetical protein
MQATAVIFLGEEARLAIVTALHDMQRSSINVDARAAGHAGMLTQNKSCLALVTFPHSNRCRSERPPGKHSIVASQDAGGRIQRFWESVASTISTANTTNCRQ